MKKYERPMVLVNEEMSEGVYAASGECFVFQQPWNPEQIWGTTQYKLGANMLYDQQKLSHGDWSGPFATVDSITLDVKVVGTGITCTKAECANTAVTVNGVTPMDGGAMVRITIPGSCLGSSTGGFDFQLYVDSSTPASISSVSLSCEHHF